jgi:hypothetical protein
MGSAAAISALKNGAWRGVPNRQLTVSLLGIVTPSKRRSAWTSLPQRMYP